MEIKSLTPLDLLTDFRNQHLAKKLAAEVNITFFERRILTAKGDESTRLTQQITQEKQTKEANEAILRVIDEKIAELSPAKKS